MPEKIVLNIIEIMKLLPHRFPFLLVDRVEIIEEGKKAVGYKNVTMNEDCFNGHFPGNPIFPGVLSVEALAQTAGVLMLRLPQLKGKLVMFAAIKDVKFRRPVLPGDTIVMEIEVLRFGGRIAFIKGVSKVAGEIVVEAEMTAAVIDNPNAPQQ
jgi:3-hydroxyacyl-[acyl-carrier-protein] dehydratase